MSTESLRRVVITGSLITVVCSSISGSVGASTPGPVEQPRHGSEAIGSPVQGVMVQSQTLDVTCGTESCSVTTGYVLTSDADVATSIELVLPLAGFVGAWINEEAAPVDMTELEPTPPPTSAGVASEPQPRWRARFPARLRAGRNRVSVRYEQPLGSLESARGYFASSSAGVFRYELWPLKEWAVSDRFSLQTSLTLHRPAGWLDWLAPPAPIVTCSALQRDREASHVLLGRSLGDDATETYISRLGRDFPDTIECRIDTAELDRTQPAIEGVSAR